MREKEELEKKLEILLARRAAGKRVSKARIGQLKLKLHERNAYLQELESPVSKSKSPNESLQHFYSPDEKLDELMKMADRNRKDIKGNGRLIGELLEEMYKEHGIKLKHRDYTTPKGKIVLDIIDDLSRKNVNMEEVFAGAKAKGLDVKDVDDVIEELKRHGVIFEPKRGFFARL